MRTLLHFSWWERDSKKGRSFHSFRIVAIRNATSRDECVMNLLWKSNQRDAPTRRSGISVHTFGAAFPVVLCNNVRWLINDRLECNFQWKIVSPQQQTLPAHQIITKMGRVWNSIAQLVVRRLRRQSVTTSVWWNAASNANQLKRIKIIKRDWCGLGDEKREKRSSSSNARDNTNRDWDETKQTICNHRTKIKYHFSRKKGDWRGRLFSFRTN